MPVFLQDLNSLFIKQQISVHKKTVKNPPNNIIPHNLQQGKPWNSIEDESTRIYFILNPGFNKKEKIHSRENINVKDSQTYSYMKLCSFRCENMMVVFYLLSFVFLYEPMEKMANSDISVKQRVYLKSGQLEDNKFRGPEVAHLYLNGLLFCLN